MEDMTEENGVHTPDIQLNPAVVPGTAVAVVAAAPKKAVKKRAAKKTTRKSTAKATKKPSGRSLVNFSGKCKR